MILLFALIFQRRVLLDITAQVQTLMLVFAGRVALPPIALFYVLVGIVGLGQANFTMLMAAAMVVCAALVTAKWWITRDIFRNYFSGSVEQEVDHPAGWLALALIFMCSLPTPDWWQAGRYIIGQPSPNYWMNGTLLASWPFALILFWQSYRQLQNPQAGWWRWMTLWLFLLVVSKPSYALVFALVYPVFLVARHGLSRAVRWQLMPFLLLAVLLAAEYYLVFRQADSVYVRQFNRGNRSGVEICLCCVWNLYSSDIARSVLAGVAFPLGVAFAYWTELRHKLLFWYAWAGFLASVAISASFAQTGEEYYTWAFRFQTYIASYLLFMVSAMLVWEKIKAQGPELRSRSRWLILLFSLHLLSGFVYLFKMWWTRSHY